MQKKEVIKMSQSKRVVEAQAPQKTGEENIAAKTSDELIAELQFAQTSLRTKKPKLLRWRN